MKIVLYPLRQITRGKYYPLVIAVFCVQNRKTRIKRMHLQQITCISVRKMALEPLL